MVRDPLLVWEPLEGRNQTFLPHFPAPNRLSDVWKGSGVFVEFNPDITQGDITQTTALSFTILSGGLIYSQRIIMIMVIII